MMEVDCPVVILCDWQGVKLQLLTNKQMIIQRFHVAVDLTVPGWLANMLDCKSRWTEWRDMWDI